MITAPKVGATYCVAMPPPENLSTLAALRLFVVTVREDFKRNNGPESRVTILVWRASQIARRTSGPLASLVRPLATLASLIWIRGVMGAELPASAWAGPGLKLGHGARGVILHPRATIGDRVTLFHEVTVGVARRNDEVPVVMDDVLLSAGARVLGMVTVGAGATVGANSVLLTDADPGGTYLGVPAERVDSGAR